MKKWSLLNETPQKKASSEENQNATSRETLWVSPIRTHQLLDLGIWEVNMTYKNDLIMFKILN